MDKQQTKLLQCRGGGDERSSLTETEVSVRNYQITLQI